LSSRYCWTVCILCVFAVRCAALDREAFTFTKYDLNVRIEPEQQRLGVRGTLTLRNDSDAPQKDLSLQISSSLDWRSITVAGKPVQFVSQRYTSDIDHTGALSEAIVTLPQAVPPKGTLELRIGYEGVIPLDTTRLTRIGVPADVAKHSDWDQIGPAYSAVRGVGYVVWYPVAMEAANLSEGNSVHEVLGEWREREAEANLDIKLNDSGESSQEAPILWCNGKGGPRKSEQTGEVAVADCTYDPLAATIPLFVIGAYNELDRPAVNISYLPGHENAAKSYAHAAETVAPFVAGWFPVQRAALERKATTIDLADPDAQPYESGTVLLTPLTNIDSEHAEIMAAYQLTHAAFFSPRPWINEGVAHFAQALYRERQGGRETALDFMAARLPAISDAEKSLAAEHNANTPARQSLINTNLEEFYRSKAMYVWWMLRDMVGDDALKKALAAYRPEQDKEPSYVQHLIEAQSKRDLEWFFDDWVYRDRGLPDFRIASVYPHQTMRGSYMVAITVENLGEAGAEIPVIVRMEAGEERKRLEVRGKSKSTIRLVVPAVPEEAMVNDGSVPESDMTNNRFKITMPTGTTQN
jgi:hypothetical protein